jgi:hypothetical protein
MTTKYWQEEIETLPRPGLESIQLTLACARWWSAFSGR